MKLVLRHKNSLILFVLITIFYFVFRLPNLTSQPIFADEAIYIRWAQVMKAEPTLRFLPLSDGKTPLFMWAMIPFFKLFADPLFAGRIESVLVGFLTLIGVLLIGSTFISKRVGLFAAFLIAITPYIVFFDRMALVDSMLAAFTVWSIYLGLLLIKYQRIDLAMVLGYMLGGGLLTKTPAMFNVLTVPVAIVTFGFREKFRQKRLLKVAGLWVIAVVITLGIYSILRLGPGFTSLNERNQDYVFSPLDIIGRPLDPFIPHLRDVVGWNRDLLGIVIAAFLYFGIFFGIYKKNKFIIALTLFAAIPAFTEMSLLKTFTARYLLFSVPPLLIVAAYGIDRFIEMVKVRKSILMPLVIFALLVYPGYFNYLIAFDIQKAPLPQNERIGYLEEWTAGYGMKEIAQFLTDEADKNGLTIVGTEGAFGTLPDGLEIYLDKRSHTAAKDKQILIIGGKAGVSSQIREAASMHPTYYVANKSRYSIFEEGVKLVKEYPKALSSNGQLQDSILLLKVSPLSDSSASGKIQK